MSVRSFLGLELHEAPPDHSTLSRTRRLIDLERHRAVFTWVLQRLADAKLVKGKTIGIDATTLEAIIGFTHLPRGSRNRDLRPQVEAFWGRPYSAPQMTYDLRRLRLKGLIHRIPKTHRYTATSYGLKVTFFYAKLYLRILRPHWAALLPDADRVRPSLRAALDALDREIHKLHEEAAFAA